MTKSDEIEREVEETRRDVDRTVHELETRMSPSRFLDDLMQSLRGEDGSDAIAVVARQVRQNPVPMAFVGIGMAALGIGVLWGAMEIRARNRRSGYVGRPLGSGDVAPPPEAVTQPGESDRPPAHPATTRVEPRVTPTPTPLNEPVVGPVTRPKTVA